jgi:hypothetical protein
VLRPIPAVLLLGGGVLFMGVPAARAQAPGYGGSTSYVPYAGGFGGFVPYSGGPGGGLGVQRPMTQPNDANATARNADGGRDDPSARRELPVSYPERMR